MQVKGIIWVGSATDSRQADSEFFSNVLGLRKTVDVAGFTQLVAPNGDRIELFGPDSTEHDQLDTGPVAGLWIDDAVGARQELLDAGISDVSEIERSRDGHGWLYFRAPNGNYYELCENPDPQLRRSRS